LQILLLVQHVSGTIMPIIRSSRVLYSGCCLCCSILQTGHTTLSSTPDQQLENHSTKYHRPTLSTSGRCVGKYNIKFTAVYSVILMLQMQYRIYRCPRRNGQNFGRVFLMLNYTDITQNTYIQS